MITYLEGGVRPTKVRLMYFVMSLFLSTVLLTAVFLGGLWVMKEAFLAGRAFVRTHYNVTPLVKP